jgi:hypothetical protein
MGIEFRDGGVLITPNEGQTELDPDVLLANARTAAQWLRMERRDHDADAWHKTRGWELRTELKIAWQGKVTDLYLATLAMAYVEVAEHPALKVMPTLGEITGKSPNTVKMHLVRARDRGLLTGEPGKTGGELTDLADRIILDNHPYG